MIREIHQLSPTLICFSGVVLHGIRLYSCSYFSDISLNILYTLLWNRYLGSLFVYWINRTPLLFSYIFKVNWLIAGTSYSQSRQMEKCTIASFISLTCTDPESPFPVHICCKYHNAVALLWTCARLHHDSDHVVTLHSAPVSHHLQTQKHTQGLTSHHDNIISVYSTHMEVLWLTLLISINWMKVNCMFNFTKICTGIQ